MVGVCPFPSHLQPELTDTRVNQTCRGSPASVEAKNINKLDWITEMVSNRQAQPKEPTVRGKAPVTPLLMGSLGPKMQNCRIVRQHQDQNSAANLSHTLLSLWGLGHLPWSG